MASKGKPKFRVGQVVACSDGSYGRLERNGKQLFDKDGNTYLKGAKYTWYLKSELRPLTAREAGPARGRRKP